MNQIESPSYIEFRLHLNQRQGVRIFRMPTFWDEPSKLWRGVLRLSNGKLLHCTGKDSQELQNNSNVMLHGAMNDESTAQEIYEMFKPLEWWENKENKEKQ